MKIIFNRQELINKIAPLLCAVPNKGPFPEVECIHINAQSPEEVVLTSFDLEKGFRTADILGDSADMPLTCTEITEKVLEEL